MKHSSSVLESNFDTECSHNHQQFVIGILTRNGVPAIALIIAIMKSERCVYFYVDPENIYERKTTLMFIQPVFFVIDEFYLNDISNYKWLFTEGFTVLKQFNVLGTTYHLIKCNRKTNSSALDNMDKLAYVITTSGTSSTAVSDDGVTSTTAFREKFPKIVYVSRKCVIPNVLDFQHIFCLTKYSVFFSAAPLTFDPSIVNILATLWSGGELVFASNKALLSPRLVQCLVDRRVNVIQATPSLLVLWNSLQPLCSSLFKADNSHVRIVVLGGEPLPSLRVLRQWFGGASSCLDIKLYNLYGVTEVSSWATVKSFSLDEAESSNASEISCDLGDTLTDTVVCIVGTNGEIITSEGGLGEIYIGRKYNCVVMKYTLQDNGSYCYASHTQYIKVRGVEVMSTGDLGVVKQGRILFRGRVDSMVKYYGKKVYLSDIEADYLQFSEVMACHVVFYYNRFIIFVAINNTGQRDIIQSRSRIRGARHSIPRHIVFIDSLPINEHGKINEIELITMYKRINYQKNIDVHKVVLKAWTDVLGASSSSDKSFLNLGGNSFNAVSLIESLETQLLCSLGHLFDTLLNKPYKMFLDAVDNAFKQSKYGSGKKVCKPFSNIETTGEIYRESSDVSDFFKNKRVKATSNIKGILSRWGYFKDGIRTSLHEECKLRKATYIWSYNMLKCIDSSPLIVEFDDGSCHVLVGSHSHIFSCLNGLTGAVVWSTELRGRIEASPTVAVTSSRVYAVCYAGFLYCMDLHSGTVLWSYKTASQVKCTPLVDFSTQNIYFGSYDKYFYCIDSEGNAKWKCNHSGGSIYASPCIHNSIVYVACLKGVVVAYVKLTGEVKWKHNFNYPVFSSLILFSRGILAAHVCKCISALSFDGDLLWSFYLDDHVYCTPSVLEIDGMDYIVVANNKGSIYIINNQGELLCKYNTGRKIVATPFLYLSTDCDYTFICVIASTCGQISFIKITSDSPHKCSENSLQDSARRNANSIIEKKSISSVCLRAAVVHSFNCVGEVFASPLVYDGRLYICGRDDHIQCYSLS